MDKTEREMIQEIYTVLLGVPNSEEHGCVGDIKNIKEQLTSLNGSVKTNTAWRKILAGFLTFETATFVGLIIYVLNRI